MATYTEEMVTTIEEIIGSSETATAEQIATLVEVLDVPVKSIGAKLRSMGISTPKKATKASFTEDETVQFAEYVEEGFNAAEIAEKMGKTPRQVYGKALSMKLHVTAPEKAEYVKKYSESEEAQLTSLVEDGKFLEEIAEAMNRSVAQIRGKLLSMKLKAPQRDFKETSRKIVYTDDVIAQLVALVNDGATAAEAAEELELNARGVKSRIGKLLKSGEITETPSDMGNNATNTLVDYTDALIDSITELASKGYTSADAAAELGIPVASLRSKSGRLKIKFAKPQKVATAEA